MHKTHSTASGQLYQVRVGNTDRDNYIMAHLPPLQSRRSESGEDSATIVTIPVRPNIDHSNI